MSAAHSRIVAYQVDLAHKLVRVYYLSHHLIQRSLLNFTSRNDLLLEFVKMIKQGASTFVAKAQNVPDLTVMQDTLRAVRGEAKAVMLARDVLLYKPGGPRMEAAVLAHGTSADKEMWMRLAAVRPSIELT